MLTAYVGFPFEKFYLFRTLVYLLRQLEEALKSIFLICSLLISDFTYLYGKLGNDVHFLLTII